MVRYMYMDLVRFTISTQSVVWVTAGKYKHAMKDHLAVVHD